MSRQASRKLRDWLATLQSSNRLPMRGWSWPAGLGAALVACAIAVAALVTPALEREAEARRAEAQQARLQALRLSQRSAAPTPQRAGADAFRSAFPPPSLRARRVASLLATAEHNGLSIRRAEFRYQPEPALGLARYRVILPAEGDYAAVRGFIAQSLNQDAALALDGLRLTRPDDGAGGLRAELRLTLYQQIDAGDGASR